MLWSIFITYIITHHGLGGFSGLINGLIAAAIGALSMLMSEPTAESYVKRTCMFVLSIATFTLHLHYQQFSVVSWIQVTVRFLNQCAPKASFGVVSLAVYISLMGTLRKVSRGASCKALRWNKVNTIRRVCIVQYRIVFSFH